MIQKQDEPPVNPFENGTSSSENLSEQAGVAARSSSTSNQEETEKPPVNPFEDAEEPADPPREFAPVVNRPKLPEKISAPSVEQKEQEDEPAVNPFEDDEKQPLRDEDEGKEDVQLTAAPVDDPPYHVPGRVTYSTEPISLVCQKCKKTVMSEICNVPSWKNRMAAQLLCYICCCCLSPCAYCDKDLQEKKHFCPDCHSFLGVYAK